MDVTIGERIKDLETQLGIVCLTKRPKLNQAEPEWFEFLVNIDIHIPKCAFRLHKKQLNILSAIKGIVVTAYTVGFNSGTEYGKKEMVNKFKALLEI